MRSVIAASLLLVAACERDEVGGNNQAQANGAAAQPESDVGTAERLVRERLGNAQGLTFANPVRTASEGIPLVCGQYTQGGATHRYVVVAGEDVFLEPEMEPGEMERAYAEFCREGAGNRPAPVAPQENRQ